MKYNGINPNGRILASKKLNKDIEIGLIEESDTGTLLWRYYDFRTQKAIDFEESVAIDVWKFEDFCKKAGLF